MWFEVIVHHLTLPAVALLLHSRRNKLFFYPHGGCRPKIETPSAPLKGLRQTGGEVCMRLFCDIKIQPTLRDVNI